MSLPANVRVVIIGGGIVGCSALYHLALKGWSDCLLLEKNELTAGSTWHAAGNVPTFSNSWSLMNMQRYSVDLYQRLGQEVDYPINYHVTGSIRLAHTAERMQEFERVVGMGRTQGMDLKIMSPKELVEIYPLLEVHDLLGGLYDPGDGDIDPAQITQALAKGARDKGARVERFCPVTGVRRQGSQWIVETTKGEVACDYVVNAAGYYAREVGKMFGRDVPMMVMSHQYILFDEIDEIAEFSKKTGHHLPLLRDVDTSYYLRQEKNGLNLGPYERGCKAHWTTPEDPMPEDFSFQLFPDDLERLEEYLEDAMARVPVLATAGLSKIINGPIPYTPDGNPLIGPMPGVPNAFEACVFTFGICQAGGAGKVLAEWIVDGETEWDMWSCDPRRFTDFTDPEYCIAKGMEVYGHEYDMHFPHHEWPAGRGKKLSPLHDRLVNMGAQMGAYNGWERANWFAGLGDDCSEQATFTWKRQGPWTKRVEQECLAVRDAAGILDLPGFSRFRVKGEGAAEWLRTFCTGGIPKVGRFGLIYVADSRGRILTEMSVMRLSQDDFFLITAATAQWHDYELIKSRLPDDAHFEVSDVTDKFMTQIFSGPSTRSILAKISDADLTQPWLSHQSAQINGTWVQLVRVSFAGELGWEIHTQTSDTAKVYDDVMKAGESYGLVPIGMYALNSLHIEKGYRTWKGDLSSDYSMLEGGLDRFVKLDKPQGFIGKQALQIEKQQGVSKRFVTLIVEAGEEDAPYMSTLWHDGKIVGETTSGDWGYRVGKSIALGMLRIDLTRPGTTIDIEIYGKKYKATVQPDQPLWDPENKRLRS
jgi:dimethylglycine dehydrogenase